MVGVLAGMSYCSIGPDSDVYVIATDGQFSCVGCAKASKPFKTRVEIYNHLVAHVFSEDKVPEDTMKRLLAEHRAEIQDQTPKWTPEEAQEMLGKLSLYYKEPVKPISQYCKAFETWQKAVEAGADRAVAEGTEEPLNAQRSLKRMAEVIREVSLLVSKSNLLARLLYDGEELRTEPCPIHKGHWSGCTWGEGCCPHCMSGCNVTGWIASNSNE